MFALVFRFPAGCYHATPWGRHVNEGDVAWPPEPYRIMRALIATWHRKADQAAYDRSVLRRLIEALAQADPVFDLPDAVHTHTRHYMPQGRIAGRREDTKLVFDAFLRVDPDEELIVAWPELHLEPDLLALAQHLSERMTYLGRGESLALARVSTDTTSRPYNGIPVDERGLDPGWTAVDILAPLSAADYAQARPSLLALSKDKPRSTRRKVFEATLPPSLLDALEVETSQIQIVGWSRPPAGRVISYKRREVGPLPSSSSRRSKVVRDDHKPTVARLVLAGRPRPQIEEAVKIGEVFRQALIARIGTSIPATVSGRDEQGKPLRDPAHGHAFFLPEDNDGDGFVDHLILFTRAGIELPVRRAIEGLRRLWIADYHRPKDEESRNGQNNESGRREWRLALESFGHPDFFPDSDLLRLSTNWISVTPYLRPWHAKQRRPEVETLSMAEEECRRRGLPIVKAEFDSDPDESGPGRSITIAGRRRNVLHFHRFRGRRGLPQPDRSGASLRLTFAKPISGPLALGYGCHYGLGLFRGAPD